MEVRKITPFEGTFDEDGVQVSSGQNEFGQEMPDPVPMAVPVGYNQSPTLADMIKRMVRNQLLAQAANAEDIDTFEEAEDFEIEDDPLDPHTPYEAVFDPPLKVPQTEPNAVASGGGSQTAPPAPPPNAEALKPIPEAAVLPPAPQNAKPST